MKTVDGLPVFDDEDFIGEHAAYGAIADHANALLAEWREARRKYFEESGPPHDMGAHKGEPFSLSGLVDGCARCEWLVVDAQWAFGGHYARDTERAFLIGVRKMEEGE